MRHFKGISVGVAWGLEDDRAEGDDGRHGLRRNRSEDGPMTGLLTFEGGDLVRGDLPQCIHCIKDDDCCFQCAAQGCEGGADCLCDRSDHALFGHDELGVDGKISPQQRHSSVLRPQY